MAQIFFATRELARNHSRATGFKSKLVDNGKEAPKGQRYGCTVSTAPAAPIASRASAPRTVTVVGRNRVERTVQVMVKKTRSIALH